jgi:2-iminobutanoate/2-iminopropanoate deaminase
MARKIIRTDALMTPIAHFSHGLRVGNEIHLGATAGTDAYRRLAGSEPGRTDAGAQADQTYRNMKLALELLGGRLEDVVRLKSYITDWRDLSACEAAFSKYFPRSQPSHSMVATWGFPLPFAVIEAELTAVVEREGEYHYAVGAGEDPQSALSGLMSILADGSLAARDVVKVTVTLSDLRDYPKFEEAFTRAFRPPYPARTVSIAPLLDPRARVELESIACRGGGEPVAGRGFPRATGTASPGMLAGQHLFMGAQWGLERDGRMAIGVEAQARAAWRRIEAILDEAGMSRDHIVRTNNWLTDWRSYGAFNVGYGAFVEAPYPPRTTVIGGLVDPLALVQIEPLAHRDGWNATVLEVYTQERNA